mmetsp:Transcript_42450/g.117130  ORF Transcript_42450/g.117130 Transcript_42450/m.117130 type:complete len:217 (-) Transcript_42450:353-1003(-)
MPFRLLPPSFRFLGKHSLVALRGLVWLRPRLALRVSGCKRRPLHRLKISRHERIEGRRLPLFATSRLLHGRVSIVLAACPFRLRSDSWHLLGRAMVECRLMHVHTYAQHCLTLCTLEPQLPIETIGRKAFVWKNSASEQEPPREAIVPDSEFQRILRSALRHRQNLVPFRIACIVGGACLENEGRLAEDPASANEARRSTARSLAAKGCSGPQAFC